MAPNWRHPVRLNWQCEQAFDRNTYSLRLSRQDGLALRGPALRQPLVSAYHTA